MGYERLDRQGRERYLDRAVLAGRGYSCLGLLGQGAFSDVYCVEDAAGGGRYACKVSWHGQMLEREAKVLEGLHHPLYPEFYAFWREAEIGILLREYVEGDSLEEVLKQRRFSASQTVRIGLMLAEGLGYLHELPERLLFRDVKPANIILRPDGGVKLVDFGCVCSMAAQVASRAGSPGFAAPEQLRGGSALTPACDVYGLGKTLAVMLGDRGRRLQNPEKKRRTLGEWRTGRRLRRVLKACTEEETAQRMADMGEVARQLKQIAVHFHDTRNEMHTFSCNFDEGVYRFSQGDL